MTNTAVSGEIYFPHAKLTSSGWSGHYTPILPKDDEITEFEEYDVPDWDGYGAAPISRATTHAARRFMSLLPRTSPPADIAPGADGTIGFEWRIGSGPGTTSVFVDIGPGDSIKARRIVAGRPETWPTRPLNIGAYHLMPLLFPQNFTT